jgi:hypothetical protein
VLFNKTVVLYSGLVALVAPLVCFRVSATVVPQAACKVCNTFEVAVSFRKSSVIVLASKPFTRNTSASAMIS